MLVHLSIPNMVVSLTRFANFICKLYVPLVTAWERLRSVQHSYILEHSTSVTVILGILE